MRGPTKDPPIWYADTNGWFGKYWRSSLLRRFLNYTRMSGQHLAVTCSDVQPHWPSPPEDVVLATPLTRLPVLIWTPVVTRCRRRIPAIPVTVSRAPCLSLRVCGAPFLSLPWRLTGAAACGRPAPFDGRGCQVRRVITPVMKLSGRPAPSLLPRQIRRTISKQTPAAFITASFPILLACCRL